MGPAPFRRQAITWSNAAPVYWRISHWDRVTHICVSKLTIIGSDNGLVPGRRQAIIWSNAEILSIGPLGTNFDGSLIEIHGFSFKKIHFKMSSRIWGPFCLGPNMIYAKLGGDELTMLVVSWVNYKCICSCSNTFAYFIFLFVGFKHTFTVLQR